MSGMKDTLGDTPYNNYNDLFGFTYTHTRSHDPETSAQAAASIFDRLNTLQRETYEAFKAIHPNGMTDLDLQRRFNNHRSTYRTRRAELVELGLLRDSGKRVSQEGSHRIVWVLKESTEEASGS